MWFAHWGAGLALLATAAAQAAEPARAPLDPCGRVHIPIGIPNTVDTLKTFVEAEGCFSPGFATYGIYFWIYDDDAKQPVFPTYDDVPCTHGLAPGGLPIPWSAWRAGDVRVRTEVCQVRRPSPKGKVHVVAARAHLTNTGRTPRAIRLYVALRAVGPAGGEVTHISVFPSGEPADLADGPPDRPERGVLFVDGHPAVIADEPPQSRSTSAQTRLRLPVPEKQEGHDAGAIYVSLGPMGHMAYDVSLRAGETRTFGFICPVLAGRRAVGHRWDGKAEWAQFDLAEPNPAEGGVLQPDPGLDYYRRFSAETVFEEARAYWTDFFRGFGVETPDPRWAEALNVILAHAAIAMNEGAPDVAVVNYNVFNRDGVYVASMLQRSGRFDLAEAAIDYFLRHPFNGRTHVEADNPGQILWVMGEHWRITRDREWLERVYPQAAKIAAMIRYYRTTPGPHWVKATSLAFGDALPPDAPGEPPAHRRQVLKPGSCDGHHPEYTEAFDVAGLRAAALFARAAGRDDDAAAWSGLADDLMEKYDAQFGGRLTKGYGSYCVLWPCRLYPLGEGKAHDAFRGVGPQKPGGWRYFALARAHQALLAGNREAACGTIARHLDHPQMQGWYALDEGGKSGAGGWGHARTTWNPNVAMPHGWAVAELWHLVRDALLFEDGKRLVLLGGIPSGWFRGTRRFLVRTMPTHFGPCTFRYEPDGTEAVLTLSGRAAPPGGFVLRLPENLAARVRIEGKDVASLNGRDYALPAQTRRVHIDLAPAR
jgi:hypothetical protein